MSDVAGVTERLSRTLAESLDAFRQQDRFFKAQAAILVAWLLLSGATIAGVNAAGRAENQLGADVRAEAAIGGPVLFVTNTGKTNWSDITYTLNGVYVARQAALEHGDHATIPLKRFRKGGAAGQRAPHDLVPKVFSIRCEQGQFQLELDYRVPK